MSDPAERKQDAIRALTSGDRETLSEMGWGRVFAAIIHRFQRYGSQSTLGGQESLAWLEVLGDRDPDAVVAAIDIWAGDGNSQAPKPADILALLTHKTERHGPDTENRLRLDNNPATLRLVHDQLVAGEHVCDCSPSPATLVQDAKGILFCPNCAGIETGQAIQARELFEEDLEPAPDVELHDLTAVVRLHRVRQTRAARVIEERRLAAR